MRSLDVEQLGALRSPRGRRLLVDAAGLDGDAWTVSARLRDRGYDADLVAAALTQLRLRHHGAGKFGADAERMWFTPDGLEQATRADVAAHHAARYTRAGITRVLDLCCGVGGDLLALARAGIDVTGVDADPLTAAIAQANAEDLALPARVRCSDVLQVDLAATPAAFLDPARRTARGRVFDPDAYSPPVSYLERLAAAVPATGAKLAPGLPHDRVPSTAEAEWVSVGGAVKEAALWFGPLRSSARRRATLLASGATVTDAEAPEAADVRRPGRYLVEPDGAVIRAGLVTAVAAELDGWLLDATIAYVATDAPPRTRFGTGYQVLDVLPVALKRLRAALRERGVGAVVVKKRGSAHDVVEVARALRGPGSATATIVLTRCAGQPAALLVRPCSAAG